MPHVMDGMHVTLSSLYSLSLSPPAPCLTPSDNAPRNPEDDAPRNTEDDDCSGPPLPPPSVPPSLLLTVVVPITSPLAFRE